LINRELGPVHRYSGVPFDYKPRSTRRKRRKIRVRWILTAVTLSLVGGLVAYMPVRDITPTPPLSPPAVIQAPEPSEPAPEAVAPAAPPQPVDATAASKPTGEEIAFTVRRRDTLERIFRRLKLSLDDLGSMLRLPRVRRSFRHIRPGDKVTVVHDDGAVESLSRRISETQVLSVTRGDDGFSAEVITTPIETKLAYAGGTVESSLFVAARAAGVSPETILRMANNIFGWDIDFALDIRPGDRFNMVYEQKYRDGQYIGDGRILAAEFVNDGDTYSAVRYTSEDGKIDDYFTPEGRSVRRQFLRAPVDFTRISSNFNLRRRHPILHIVRPHQGVDYAAPIGTRIKAAGDGRVGFVGWKGGYGRVIILEHGAGISTLYGHMSRFVRGLHRGERVKQGQTVGYVGRSGAATGPHLHYEYRINGVHRNPRTVKLPDAAPLPARYMADFQVKAGVLLTNLEQAHGTAVATAAAN
jgi:murein DD-endopeptidase MepM/ murein hydrolase activator NlpD